MKDLDFELGDEKLGYCTNCSKLEELPATFDDDKEEAGELGYNCCEELGYCAGC